VEQSGRRFGVSEQNIEAKSANAYQPRSPSASGSKGATMSYVVWWTLFGIAITGYTVWVALVWKRKPKRQEEV
jgi:hypothetical protein